MVADQVGEILKQHVVGFVSVPGVHFTPGARGGYGRASIACLIRNIKFGEIDNGMADGPPKLRRGGSKPHRILSDGKGCGLRAVAVCWVTSACLKMRPRGGTMVFLLLTSDAVFVRNRRDDEANSTLEAEGFHGGREGQRRAETDQEGWV